MPSPRASLAVLAVLAAALLAAPQALGAAQLRIVGGTAPSQAWPAQTWVRVEGYGKTATCGGTLVSARWVMTAGHCVTAPDLSVLAPDAFNDSKSSNKLRVGSVDHKNGGFTSDVDGVVRIPTYNNPAAGTQPTYDLGLLHLKDVAPQDPLPLIDATPADIPFWSPGVSATVLGWGRTEDDSSSSTLLEARVPIVSDGDCAAAWPAPSAEVPSPFSPFSMVCAGGASTDTCEGDSGGPLIAPRNGAPTLVGVTSWGSGPQCAAGKPGVYVRLGDPAINEWVRSWVPAVVLTSSASTAVVSEPVEFSGAALGPATVEWDTNADGVFGDAGGPSLSLSFATVGIHAVAARATYPDGDRTAIARTTVDVTEAPPPPPPGTSPRGGGSGTAAPGGSAGATGTTATTATTSDAAGNRVTLTTQMKLRTLRESGVRVRFECARACSITGQLKLGPMLARRYHLGRTSVRIARGTARLSKKGAGVLTLRLTAKPKRALRNASRITATLRTELRAGGAALRGARAITVRR